MLNSGSKVTINTGNVLNLIDIKKKAGQNVTEELSESLKLTLSEWHMKNGTHQNGAASPEELEHNTPQADLKASPPVVIDITRPLDDVQAKMAEEERKNLKIGVKIFINDATEAALIECMENVFAALPTSYIDSVILAYNPDILHNKLTIDDNSLTTNHSTKSSPISLGSNTVRTSSSEMEADSEADAKKCEAILPGIKVLWTVLENYVKEGRVRQLGVADVGGGCARALHAWARVRPAIAQINLAACCVVPPALHAYCRAHDVQLLTHGDPPDFLKVSASKTNIGSGIGCSTLDWCARYQVHIKCRGVLALKGFVCKATLEYNSFVKQ